MSSSPPSSGWNRRKAAPPPPSPPPLDHEADDNEEEKERGNIKMGVAAIRLHDNEDDDEEDDEDYRYQVEMLQRQISESVFETPKILSKPTIATTKAVISSPSSLLDSKPAALPPRPPPSTISITTSTTSSRLTPTSPNYNNDNDNNHNIHRNIHRSNSHNNNNNNSISNDADEKSQMYREQLDRARQVLTERNMAITTTTTTTTVLPQQQTGTTTDHHNNYRTAAFHQLSSSTTSTSSILSASSTTRRERATRPGAVAMVGPPEYHFIPMQSHRPLSSSSSYYNNNNNNNNNNNTMNSNIDYVVPVDALHHVPMAVVATSVEPLPLTATTATTATIAPEASRHNSRSHHSRGSRDPSTASSLGSYCCQGTDCSSCCHHPLNKEERRLWYLGALVTICLLTLAAVFTGYQVHKNKVNNSNNSNNNSNGKGSTTTTTTKTINGMTQFDAITTNCKAVASQSNPHVVSQCLCTGTISYIASDIVDRYETLISFLIPSIFPISSSGNVNNTLFSLHSCQLHNQALVWLASGDGASSIGTPKSKMRQRYVLAILYLAWNGPTWSLSSTSSSSLWISADDECTWYGITCDSPSGSNDDVLIHHDSLAYNSKFLGVSGMSLKDLNLNSLALPSELGLLTNLKTIFLTSTGLEGTIPLEMFNAKLLQVVDLSKNSLIGTIPTQIGHLNQLERLFMVSNMLSGSIPSELCNCTGLKLLNLKNNLLNGSVPLCLGSMPHLTSACFVNTPINKTSRLPCIDVYSP